MKYLILLSLFVFNSAKAQSEMEMLNDYNKPHFIHANGELYKVISQLSGWSEPAIGIICPDCKQSEVDQRYRDMRTYLMIVDIYVCDSVNLKWIQLEKKAYHQFSSEKSYTDELFKKWALQAYKNHFK